KSFGKHKVFSEISFKVTPNKITAIVGPNGSGKTTLIKSILGLVNFDTGEILFDGKSINNDISYRYRIGYLPQVGSYPENLRVSEVFELIMSLRGNKNSVNLENLISIFSLRPYLDYYIRNLSRGTIQKISAVIALMFDYDVYILDEPTAGLDPISVVELKNLIRERKRNHSTFIIISHQLAEIESYADYLIFLLNGRIVINEEIQMFVERIGKSNLEESVISFLKQIEQS
ncbi:MAG: ABC transporter ATP-binding protein, partial [Candidatus Kapaibacteriota bacterium]